MLILPSASAILFQAITPGASASGARLDTAYLEFVNGPSVTPPDINPGKDVEYYDRLETTPDRDYLRCTILSHSLSSVGDKAKLALVIVSDGDTGVHGKPFSATAGSKVYGVALAASQSNQRSDILFGREYFPEEEQVEKPENGGVMISLDLVLA